MTEERSSTAWEVVIGLEVHVQLACRSKLFSGASTAFGAPPNSQVCAIDMGLPGTLPSVNREAVDMAIRFGLAANARINRTCVFERKNYFYPDLPKGYQTTQLRQPIVGAGFMDVQLDDGSDFRVRIHHAHLEEDAGKSLHDFQVDSTAIDLNRAGMPLLEIVTEPDLRSACQAVAFARQLHALVAGLGICDGHMEQGSLRFDVNVSVRPGGSSSLGTRTETKNLNSFRFMEQAIEQEVRRQINLLERGAAVRQETRLYNGETGQAAALRTKEEAGDYRYFPCPDLLPVRVEQGHIDHLRASLPERPEMRQARLMDKWGLPAAEAALLAEQAATASYFEATAMACDDARLAAQWITGTLARNLKRDKISLQDSPVSAEALGGLLQRVKDNTLSAPLARQVFDALWQGEGSCADDVIASQGLRQVTDESCLERLVEQVLTEHPEQVKNYKAADSARQKKMIGFFVGQAMKTSKGTANPEQLNRWLHKKLS